MYGQPTLEPANPPRQATRRAVAPYPAVKPLPSIARAEAVQPRPAVTRAAFAFASARHAGQYREIDGAPFIAHPLEVGRLLRRDAQPDDVVAAGLLHDVLEKTGTTPQELEHEFGTRIAKLVAAVSDDPNISDYDERKRELRDRVARSDADALAIYAADKISKVRELGLLSRWRVSQRNKKAKLAHYRESLEMLRRATGQSDLVDRLDVELGALDPPAVVQQRHAM